VRCEGEGSAGAPHRRSRLAAAPPLTAFTRPTLIRTVHRGGPPALVALVTVLAFLPGVFGEFVRWDDDRNYLDQLQFRGLGPRHLSWMFTVFHMGHYHPLTWLTIGADYVLWGMNPLGYHLTSLLLHTGTAVTFFFVAHRLIHLGMAGVLREPALTIGAAGAALLFAVHPLRVESVVWLSERRDVLSGLFYMLAVLAYLKAVEGDGAPQPGRRAGAWGWYWAALVFFACGLLSKALVLSLPLVLVILDVFPLRRLGGAVGWTGPQARRVWMEKLPFAALALGGAVLAFAARAPLNAAPGLVEFDLVARAVVSAYGLAFYVWKTVWPVGLSPLYEMPIYLYLLSPVLVASYIGVVGLGVAAIVARRRWPAFTAAACAYAVTLAPVIGVVQSGPQITADRYTYLACLGWAVLLGGGVAWCADRWLSRAPGRRWCGAALLVGTGVVVVLVSLTARQSLIWHDSVTLWRHAMAVDPTSARARTGLASALFDDGRHQDARQELEHALKLNPRLPEALSGMALMMTLSEKPVEAVQYARRVVAQRPGDANMYCFLGEVLAMSRRPAEALAVYQEAARLDPRSATSRYGIAVQLAALGRAPEAVVALEEAHRRERETNPYDPERERYTALVHSRSDPERAKAAWRSYLRAMGALTHPSRVQMARMIEALGALEALETNTGEAPRRD